MTQTKLFKFSFDLASGNRNYISYLKRGNRKIKAKGFWLVDIKECVDRINKDVFYLEDIYTFKCELSKKHPLNNSIKAKIRQ